MGWGCQGRYGQNGWEAAGLGGGGRGVGGSQGWGGIWDALIGQTWRGGPNSRGTGDALMGCVGQQWDGGRWEVGGGGNTAGLGATWGGGHLKGTPWMGAAINGGGCPAPPPPQHNPKAEHQQETRVPPPQSPLTCRQTDVPAMGRGPPWSCAPPPSNQPLPVHCSYPRDGGGSARMEGGGTT